MHAETLAERNRGDLILQACIRDSHRAGTTYETVRTYNGTSDHVGRNDGRRQRTRTKGHPGVSAEGFANETSARGRCGRSLLETKIAKSSFGTYTNKCALDGGTRTTATFLRYHLCSAHRGRERRDRAMCRGQFPARRCGTRFASGSQHVHSRPLSRRVKVLPVLSWGNSGIGAT